MWFPLEALSALLLTVGAGLPSAALPAVSSSPSTSTAQPTDSEGEEPPAGTPAPAGVSVLETAPEGTFRVDRGPGRLPLFLPRDEELTFRARIRWGLIDTRVGTITLSTGVEPYRESVLFGGGGGASGRETAWVRARASGRHTFYSMDSTVESRFQPQTWPSMVLNFRQEGSERRRRETLVGIRDGERVRSYRSDTSSGAPRGTRIWRPAQFAPVPEGAMDSIVGVYLLRTMLLAGEEEVEFPMLDKERLWWVHSELGETRRVDTHVGSFEARAVRIASTRLDLSADVDEQIAKLERPDAPDPDFEGPFGIRGDIRLWVEQTTGVPLWIEGDLPIGPITLNLDIRLERFRGTPEAFRPIGD